MLDRWTTPLEWAGQRVWFASQPSGFVRSYFNVSDASIKPGASIYGLRNEVLDQLPALQALWNLGGCEFQITSGTDGKHGEPSFHYCGLAVDLFTHGFDRSVVPHVLEMTRHLLGPDYDVVLEDFNLPNEHIHVEFDDGSVQPVGEAARIKTPAGNVPGTSQAIAEGIS